MNKIKGIDLDSFGIALTHKKIIIYLKKTKNQHITIQAVKDAYNNIGIDIHKTDENLKKSNQNHWESILNLKSQLDLDYINNHIEKNILNKKEEIIEFINNRKINLESINKKNIIIIPVSNELQNKLIEKNKNKYKISNEIVKQFIDNYLLKFNKKDIVIFEPINMAYWKSPFDEKFYCIGFILQDIKKNLYLFRINELTIFVYAIFMLIINSLCIIKEIEIRNILDKIKVELLDVNFFKIIKKDYPELLELIKDR